MNSLPSALSIPGFPMHTPPLVLGVTALSFFAAALIVSALVSVGYLPAKPVHKAIKKLMMISYACTSATAIILAVNLFHGLMVQ